MRTQSKHSQTALLVCLLGPPAHPAAAAEPFPPELVNFVPHQRNPVFTAAGPGHWDVKIRERGWILREEDTYHMWFTGYDGTNAGLKRLGYATSPDGLRWTRYPHNPIYRDHWVEDMMVVKDGDTYYMFAEGFHDRAHLLTSKDRIHWTRRGELDIRTTNGKPLTPGPFGTPTAWLENGTWHLFYERYDKGIWLATSKDLKIWKHVQDDPVMVPGPENYDNKRIALNQIVKYKKRYYAYYHCSGSAEPDRWSTNVAASTDLLHWTKYPKNPILGDNKSSGILIHDGTRFRLYAMHDQVRVHFPRPR